MDAVAQRKFDRAMGQIYRAILSDLDDTLTLPGRLIPLEAVTLLTQLLRAGIPVGIVTARSLRGDQHGEGAKLVDLVTQLKAHLHTERVSSQQLLQYLYLFPESGSYLVRADELDPEPKIRDLGLVSAAKDPTFTNEVKRLMEEFGLSDGDINAAKSGRRHFGQKAFTLTLRGIPPECATPLQVRIEALIQQQGKAYEVSQSKDSMEICPAGGGKGFALKQFVQHLKRDDPPLAVNEADVATLGDKGRRDGGDYPLIDRVGGFSVDEAEPDSDQVPVPEVLGLCGWPAAAWILPRLEFAQRFSPRLLVLAGPSASGKTTFASRLLQEHPDTFVRLVRTTTRPPRPGEEKLHDHRFLTREQFNDELATGAILFPRTNYGYWYGFACAELAQAVRSGKTIVMEAWGTAMEMSRTWPGVALRIVAILPLANKGVLTPEDRTRVCQTLRQRIKGRDPSIPDAEIDRRTLAQLDDIPRMQAMADLVLENAQDAPFELLYRRLETFAAGPLSVAVSLGGTKLSVALVYSDGSVQLTSQPIDWRAAFGVDHEKTEDTDQLVAGIVDLIEGARRRVALAQVTTIGISTKGPLEEREGQAILGPGTKTTTLPFLEYPLATRVREMLVGRYGWKSGREPLSRMPIRVLHDGAAAILGEVSVGGTLSGFRDAAAVIIGTGVGLGIVEAGQLYEGLQSTEGTTADDDAKVRVLGSLGRHLIHIVDNPESPADYRYEYRGVLLTKSKAELSPGETYLSERVAGPWLARRIADMLAARLSADPSGTAVTLGLMALTQEEVHQFTKAGDKVLETKILAGLTLAGQRGDRWAHEQISTIGTEVGRALAEFVWAFRERAFVRHILLVSSVAEKLGAGVGSETSGDLFLERLRHQVEAVLHAKGLGHQEAYGLAEGIRRSRIDFRREFLAFVPQGESAPIVATDETNSRAFPVAFETAHTQGIPHRVVHIEITNEEAQYLVWERQDGRLEIPGGHVDWLVQDNRPETYEEAAVRETVEELNLAWNWQVTVDAAKVRLQGHLNLLEPPVINQLPSSQGNNNEWVGVCILHWQKAWGNPCAFVLSEEGNQSPCWLSLDEIKQRSLQRPMGINAALRLFLRRRNILVSLIHKTPSQF